MHNSLDYNNCEEALIDVANCSVQKKKLLAFSKSGGNSFFYRKKKSKKPFAGLDYDAADWPCGR